MERMRLSIGGTEFVRCREVVRSSECPLSEVPLYTVLVLFLCTSAVLCPLSEVILYGG